MSSGSDTVTPESAEGRLCPGQAVRLEHVHLQTLFDAVCAKGYQLIGPTVRDAAIVYDEIQGVADLPVGWTDEQEAGTYRLKRRNDDAVFGHVVGPQSWKKYLFPPQTLVWQVVRDGNTFRFLETPFDPTPLAFLGVRSCELHALAIQDRVFMEVDPAYRARREKLLILAVQCGLAGGTCFCASMGTGPRAAEGFDLALTEVIQASEHYFVIEIGTARGAGIMDGLPYEEAGDVALAEARGATQRAVTEMGRSMNAAGVKDLLYRSYEHPRWEDVAKRCLTCANCTMVCPTCFCSTVEDTTDLTGEHAERWRRWDSCFNLEFSYLHGGNIRSSPSARYRQWITHKLATWFDQFGTSGCVGCGRCITWCPVGIDITAEVSALYKSEVQHGKH